jgi:GNAT superfamily N-acetyltransferase
MEHEMVVTDQPVLLTTRTGFRVLVRPAGEADEAALAGLFAHVTAEDLRFRFLSSVRQVPQDQLVAMTKIDHRQTENFLAFTDDGAVLVATAMLACDPDMRRAEVAVAIHSAYKGRGLGWELLRHVADAAKARGIATIESIESRSNRSAIEVEKDLGFVAHMVVDDATVVRLSKALSTP